MALSMNILSLWCLKFYFLLFLILLTFDSALQYSCELENPLYSILKPGHCKVRDLHENFSTWSFTVPQLLTSVFPLDNVRQNYVRTVKDCIFSVTYPIPLKSKTKFVAVSESALVEVLDLPPEVIDFDLFLRFVSGGYVITGSTPLSHRYGGHQFGYWSDQLGDGRAVMLGEYVNRKGERWELQLKGSGLTPYSRRGDGRAVLRSSVREFLGSEAMYHLGIPTSRAAALVVSDDPVMRDKFYDGHPQVERGAVVLRLAQSWFRIGSIENLTKNREIGLLRRLVDFVIEHHFPEIDLFDKDRYLQLFSTIVRQTAEMIAKWQSVGFTHGVCNTDNYSLLSITIDYGPFGFLDEYNPDFIPNTSDDEGRYNYRKQPDIGLWNLDKLRIAMLPLLNQDQKKQIANILNGYESIYSKLYIETFLKKLGLKAVESDDDKFIGVLLIMMENTASDFTMTFREMSEIPLERIESLDFPSNTWALKILSKHEWFGKWIRIYRKRIAKEGIHVNDDTRQTAMSAVNPRYVLRNWMAQSAIRKAERNDFSEVRSLLRILETPHKYQEDAEEAGYSSPPPSWAKSLKVSCSS